MGSASFVAPPYISETAPVAIRGKRVSINQVALTSGNVSAGGKGKTFEQSEAHLARRW
jgi:hypothetical protein